MIVKGILYTQSFDNPKEDFLQDIDLSNGEYQQIKCFECNGTGVYWITDVDYQSCVNCKTSGKIWFNVY